MEKKVMIASMRAVVLLFLVSNAIKSVHGITCQEALATLSPCLPFLTGTDPTPTGPCCLGVQTLNQEASTKEIRRQLCDCFKNAGPSIGVKPEKAKELPGLCHVQVPVPIDPSIDCSKITEYIV